MWTDGIVHIIRHSISSIPDLAPSLQKAAIESYATALRVVFISQIAINVLVFIACIPIEEHSLPCVFLGHPNSCIATDVLSCFLEERIRNRKTITVNVVKTTDLEQCWSDSTATAAIPLHGNLHCNIKYIPSDHGTVPVCFLYPRHICWINRRSLETGWSTRGLMFCV